MNAEQRWMFDLQQEVRDLQRGLERLELALQGVKDDYDSLPAWDQDEVVFDLRELEARVTDLEEKGNGNA